MHWRTFAYLTLAAAGACKSSEPAPERRPPPPAAAPTKGACEGTRRANDPANLAELPDKAGSFCLDPAGSDHGFGQGAKGPIEGICELFDGECAIYQGFGVQRVVEARYVDGAGSAATIDVKLSRFAGPEQALAMFSKRALGGGDPAHPDTPKPLAAGAMAALGIGNAYVWRGAELAEITYNDAEASAEQIAKKGDELLPALAKELGGKMAGALEPPRAVALLPAEDRLPMGIGYELPDVLVKGAGPGAFGYYKAGDKRWRVLAIVANDEAAAKDALKALSAGGAEEKGLGDAGARIAVGDGKTASKSEWLLARKGATVLGVGDEPLALRVGMSPDEHAKVCLAEADKRERLKKLLK